jgi:hypothetical protein
MRVLASMTREERIKEEKALHKKKLKDEYLRMEQALYGPILSGRLSQIRHLFSLGIENIKISAEM